MQNLAARKVRELGGEEGINFLGAEKKKKLVGWSGKKIDGRTLERRINAWRGIYVPISGRTAFCNKVATGVMKNDGVRHWAREGSNGTMGFKASYVIILPCFRTPLYEFFFGFASFLPGSSVRLFIGANNKKEGWNIWGEGVLSNRQENFCPPLWKVKESVFLSHSCRTIFFIRVSIFPLFLLLMHVTRTILLFH